MDSDGLPLRYEPLEGQQIRLIQVKRELSNGYLSCDMHHAPLTDDVRFNALSYVWGDVNNTRLIKVNSSFVEVTQNLFEFLSQVRSSDHVFRRNAPTAIEDYTKPDKVEFYEGPLYWWIDAICINQNDLDEKSVQVPRMRELYSSADRVWMWYGQPSVLFRETNQVSPHMKAGLSHPFLFSGREEQSKSVPVRLRNAILTGVLSATAKIYISRMKQSIAQTGKEAQEDFELPDEDVVIELARSGLSENEIREAVGLDAIEDRSDLVRREKQVLSNLLTVDETRLSEMFFKDLLKELTCLLEHPWFTRTWTIQEFVLSAKPSIGVIGNYSFYLTQAYQLTKDIVAELGKSPAAIQSRIMGFMPKCTPLIELVHTFAREQGLDKDSVNQTSEHELLWLLRTLGGKASTMPHDRIYGILALLKSSLPDALAPNYRLSFEQVFQDYTRHILSVTKDLRIFESRTKGFLGYPSWVPDLREFDEFQHKTVAASASVVFSDDGQELTVEGFCLGKVLSCSCHIPRGADTLQHLTYIEDVLLKECSNLPGRSLAEAFRTWLNTHMRAQTTVALEVMHDLSSMRDLIAKYKEICVDIPDEALKNLPHLPLTGATSSLYQTPLEDPRFLHAVLDLTSNPRYALVSNGEIGCCRHKETDKETREQDRSKDEIWALKGGETLAILRPVDRGYQYVGDLRILKEEGEYIKQLGFSRPELMHILDDEYFAGKDVVPVTIV